MLSYFIVAGVVIIVVLAIVAWKMQKKVNAMNTHKLAQQKEIEALQSKHHKYLNDSIQILAQGIIDDQLTLTEGAIRISVLLDNLSISEAELESYSAFSQLADSVAHIPILNAWKELPKKEKQKFEKERLATEATYKDFVLDAAKRIRGKTF